MPAELGVGEMGVLRVGYVEDLGPVFAKCRVALSPVRFGTGIKTKNLSALAPAVPLVITIVGADGMALRHNETALIADPAAGIRRCRGSCLQGPDPLEPPRATRTRTHS